jgi:hypothetical protein
MITRSTITPEEIIHLIKHGFVFTLLDTKSKRHTTYRSYKSLVGDTLLFKLIIEAKTEGNKFTPICAIKTFTLTPHLTHLYHRRYVLINRLFEETGLFNKFWRNLENRDIPTNIEFWHPCKCRRCNRLLTDPRSIEKGIGPGCEKKENKGGTPC